MTPERRWRWFIPRGLARTIGLAAVAALAALAGIGAPPPSSQAHTELRDNPVSYSREVDRLQGLLQQWEAARAELTAALDGARRAASAAGTQWAQAELATLLESVATEGLVCGDYRQMLQAAAHIRAETQALSERTAAEQAAAQAAAEQAAAEQAAQQQAASGRSGGDWSSRSGGGSYVVYVGSSASGPEDQWIIDLCDGAADVSAWYGVPSVAEHWSCGGSSFPTTPGARVTLTGRLSGEYEVIGVVAVLDAAVNSTADVPGGYDLIYQTCIGGSSSSMEIVALNRIG